MTTKEVQQTHIFPWFTRLRSVILITVVLFLILSAICIFLCYNHFQKSVNTSLVEDRTAAGLLALLINTHCQKILKTMESYANRPLLIEAVQKKNAPQARKHLANLIENNPDIDVINITDPQGTLWLSQPARPGIVGKNISYRDWYRVVSNGWQTYVSDTALRLTANHETAIHIAVPIRDRDHNIIGILYSSQTSSQLIGYVRETNLSKGVTVSAVDRKGRIIFSSRLPFHNKLVTYPFWGKIANLSSNRQASSTVSESSTEYFEHYLSPAMVTGVGWTVIVERNRRTILSESATYFLQTAFIFVLLFMIIFLSLLFFRKHTINQITLAGLHKEAELLASETRFRELFDHMSSGVAIYDAVGDGKDFVFSDMNMAGQRITGVSEGFIGKSVREVFPGVEEFGLFKILKQVWHTGISANHPFALYQDQQLSFWVENYVYKLPSGQIVAVFDDITARKQAEAERFRLMNIIDSSLNEIYIFNASTLLFEYVNQGAKKNLGYSEEEIKKMTPVNLKPEMSEELFRQMIRPLTTGEKKQLVFETLHRRKSGTDYPIEVHMQFHKQEGGSVFFSIISDITERKAAEEKIREINEELEERVAKRTEELAVKNAELARLNRVFVDREIRMRELKTKITQMETPPPADCVSPPTSKENIIRGGKPIRTRA